MAKHKIPHWDPFFIEHRRHTIPNTDLGKVEIENRVCIGCGMIFRCAKASQQEYHSEFCKDGGPTQRHRFTKADGPKPAPRAKKPKF